MTDKYEDIIELPHHVSKTRPRMSMSDRAAQFSAFAALTGYDAAIREAGRLTSDMIIRDEYEIQLLNDSFKALKDRLSEEPKASFVYFEPDMRKSGGAYVEYTGTVKKIDEYERLIILGDGRKLSFENILDISL